jgi:hypothetical protein
MRGLANGQPPALYRNDVVDCPEAECCPHHLYLPSLDGGESVQEWMKQNK